VVHLPSDGFFYVKESLLPVLAINQHNARHMETCSEGWACLNQTVWPELEAFEEVAREWFGYDETKKLKCQILYHEEENPIDICLLCPKENVGIEFTFEPEFPVLEVPEKFWF
jgi:hypothetical protein